MVKRSADSLLTSASMAHLQVCLRDSTRASHRAIDHHPLLAPLVKPTLTCDHYQYVLTVMRWMHGHLSAQLSEAMSEFAPTALFVPSDRLDWLARDFKSLKMETTPAPERVMEGFKPRMDSAEALVGALYVIEGSTLGGQFIAQQLAKSLQVFPGKGASFFYGHGVNTLSHWNGFWTFADSVCGDGAVDEVCAAADRMFQEFEGMLNACVDCQPRAAALS